MIFFLSTTPTVEARQVVVLLGHHAGMLGRLPADEGAAGLDAALRHAGHDLGDLLGEVLPAGDVVQEEQGLGAAAHHVVDAHGHGVDADGVVLIQQHGDFQLGAHAVGAGDQHRLLHAGKVRGEQAAKPADAGDHPGDHRALDVLFHQFHGLVPRGDVHARGLIAVTVAFHRVLPLPKKLSSFVALTGPRCRSRKICTAFPSRVYAGDGELFAAHHKVHMDDGIVDALGFQLLAAHGVKAGDDLVKAPAQGHVAGGVLIKQGVVDTGCPAGRWGTPPAPGPAHPAWRRLRPWRPCALTGPGPAPPGRRPPGRSQR